MAALACVQSTTQAFFELPPQTGQTATTAGRRSRSIGVKGPGTSTKPAQT